MVNNFEEFFIGESLMSHLFESLALRGVTLRNRIVMAPMTTWSANADGTISDSELDYYRRRVQGD